MYRFYIVFETEKEKNGKTFYEKRRMHKRETSQCLTLKKINFQTPKPC